MSHNPIELCQLLMTFHIMKLKSIYIKKIHFIRYLNFKRCNKRGREILI